MKFTKSLVIGVFSWSALVLNAQQGEIPVYLEPLSTSTQIASIDPDQVGLIESYPVLDDAKAADGWLFAEYEGTFAGFVDPSAVQKGLRIQPNTPVYLRRDSSSPVLSLIQEGDSVDIVNVGTDWAEIEFEKMVPVYFQDPSMVGYPETISREETETPEEPIPVEPLMRSGDRRPVETDEEEEEPETLDPIRTPPNIEVSPGLNPNRDSNSIRVPEGAPATDVPRSLEGKLVRASRLFGFKPKYSHELKSPGGRRIAWVDLSSVLVSSLAPYEGKQVRIYGEVQSTADANAPVVFARTLRLR